MILDICNNADIMSILRIIKIVITIIKIVVPIILIISLSLNYLSAVKDNDNDGLAKANKSAIPKIVGAILIFMIPTFVHILGNLTGETSFLHCLDIATKENINILREENAKKRIATVQDSLKTSDYQVALSEIKKIKNTDIKNRLLQELEATHEYILLDKEIDKLALNNDRNKYAEINEKINKITDQKIKEKLSKKLEEIGVGKPLNANSGPERGSQGGVAYHQILPPNPTTNLPLIVFLHGDGELGNPDSIKNLPIYQYVESNKAYEAGDFIFLAPARPTRGYDSSVNITKTKEIIDSIVEKYEVDKDRISITGMSGGAILTWGMVNAYPNFFSATLPMSCGPGSVSADNFKTTPVWSVSGTQGVERSYENSMRSFDNKINAAGGSATHTTYDGDSHSTIQQRYKNVEVFKWLINQTKKR